MFTLIIYPLHSQAFACLEPGLPRCWSPKMLWWRWSLGVSSWIWSLGGWRIWRMMGEKWRSSGIYTGHTWDTYTHIYIYIQIYIYTYIFIIYIYLKVYNSWKMWFWEWWFNMVNSWEYGICMGYEWDMLMALSGIWGANGTHTCMHTYIRIYVHTYIRTYVHTYIRACVHTYIRTYVHTYIHTLVQPIKNVVLRMGFHMVF